MAAFLAPDAIPRELFDVLLDDADSALAQVPLHAFNALRQLSLAEVNDATVSVHRLLQKTIRDDPAAHAGHTAPVSWRGWRRRFPVITTGRRSGRSASACCRTRSQSALRPTAGEAGPRLVVVLHTAAEYLLRADPQHVPSKRRHERTH